VAERDRAVEGEIDRGGDEEARRAGDLGRQAEIFGAEIGDAGVDDIADQADCGERRNLPADAASRLDRLVAACAHSAVSQTCDAAPCRVAG